MPRYNTLEPILDLDGTAYRYKDTPQGVAVATVEALGADPTWGRELTLKKMLVEAVYAQGEEDRGMSAERKCALDELGRRIHSNVFVDLKSEEVADLKKRVAALWNIALTGRAFALLEPTTPPADTTTAE